MKLQNCHWHPGINGNCGAEIDVPGLGKVHINDCLSDETKKRIEDECYAALRIKLGQVINTVPTTMVQAIQ